MYSENNKQYGSLSHFCETSGEDKLFLQDGIGQTHLKDTRKDYVSSSDKMSVNDQDHMRPRSFSDVSTSSGKYRGLRTLRKRQGNDGRYPMRFVICRESEKLEKEIEGAKLPVASEKGNVKGVMGETRTVAGDQASDGSQNLDSGSEPPPKPKLPDNYRRYFAQQIQSFKGEDSTLDSDNRMDNFNGTGDEEMERAGQSGRHTRKFSVGANITEGHWFRMKTFGAKQKSVESDFPSRNSLVTYRHYDSKMQSQILRKELDQLRTSELVRKKSETVRRRLSSDTSPNTAGGSTARVRFRDDCDAQGSNMTVSESSKNKTKKALQQSQSVDYNHRYVNISDSGHDAPDTRQIQCVQTVEGGFPPSGTLKRQAVGGYSHSGVSTGETGKSHREFAHVKDGDSKSRLPRRLSQSRGQGQPRSKSESVLNRNATYRKEDAIEEKFQEPNWDRNPNHGHMSRSVSNLHRKQDTIRKFNSSPFELKRDKIRSEYQKKGGREQRQDSGDKPDSRATGGDTMKGPKSIKSVGDNRSDEEKYAALSRDKILHVKSSSWDTQLKDRQGDNSRTRQSNASAHRDLKKVHGDKTFASEGLRTTQSTDRYHSADSLEKFYLNENKGVRSEKFNTDLPPKTREGAKGSSEDIKTINTDSKQKVVLRQCVIGEAVAFGLVGVQDTKPKPNGNGYIDGQGLVTIRMIPDEQGRFGFNVKGGADQGMPIIVSRVAPNTPADNAIPRLNEGDQVLFINGRDVSQHTHEQVVMFIRASRETHSGELVLKVRPNAYSGDENPDEPEFVYEPGSGDISAKGDANLKVSLNLLEDSLESGAALAQFEQLYRKKPGMTMNAARLDVNIPKNRYRDISPYDQTRVIMKNGQNGDYINANYVNMEIPVSGIVNRYIAAQGPLPTTCTDFWQMVWEQQSTLVVMLTTKVERGRIKCHQYWPDLYETSDYGALQITCVKEEETSCFAFREFNLTHVESQEERHISHMQYIAWPDHGVPDDPADFLDFVLKVRQKRVGLVEPSIVHCSAGIGRTGVLITMETAMCLIEANQPVYPLSIVRQMRDQRAMLIQTPNQYKFVCEAIIRCYNEGIVKPLPEYQQR